MEIDGELCILPFLNSLNEPSKLWKIDISDNQSTIPRFRTIIYSLSQALRIYSTKTIYKTTSSGVIALAIFDHDVVLDIKSTDPEISIKESIPETIEEIKFKSSILDTRSEIFSDVIQLFDVTIVDKPFEEYLDEVSKIINPSIIVDMGMLLVTHIDEPNACTIDLHLIYNAIEKRHKIIDTYLRHLS